MFFEKSIARRTFAALILAGACVATAFATLVVPPETGYWGAYSKLRMQLNGPLVLAVTPDTRSADPGPDGELGKAPLVVHVRPEHHALVDAILGARFPVKTDWNDESLLLVPLRVESAELAVSEGVLKALPWIQGGDFPLAAHDYQLKSDSGAVLPVLLAGDAARWPGDVNPALGEEREVPASVLGFRTQVADTIVPHNPATAPVAGQRDVLVAKVLAPRGVPPQLRFEEPKDGVDAVNMVIGRAYSVFHVTPDHRGATVDPTRVLVTLGDWEGEATGAMLDAGFTYRGVTYTVVTRTGPPVSTRQGTLRRTATGLELVEGATATPLVLPAHYDASTLDGWLASGRKLELEGYAEPVAGRTAFFATRLNEAQDER